jgi:hypothetical protein
LVEKITNYELRITNWAGADSAPIFRKLVRGAEAMRRVFTNPAKLDVKWFAVVLGMQGCIRISDTRAANPPCAPHFLMECGNLFPLSARELQSRAPVAAETTGARKQVSALKAAINRRTP